MDDICKICGRRIRADEPYFKWRQGSRAWHGTGPLPRHVSCKWKREQVFGSEYETVVAQSVEITCAICGHHTIAVAKDNLPENDVKCMYCQALLYKAPKNQTASGLRLDEPAPGSVALAADVLLAKGVITMNEYRHIMGLKRLEEELDSSFFDRLFAQDKKEPAPYVKPKRKIDLNS